MNNEIGRKITSLTLMTIMLAGGMVIAAPSMVPEAMADHNQTLFVSAENETFGNTFGGAQIVEVIVADPNINRVDQTYGAPIVKVNGNNVLMAQATNGSWYAYIADKTMVDFADGTGFEFGTTYTQANSVTSIGNSSLTGTQGIYSAGYGTAASLTSGATVNSIVASDIENILTGESTNWTDGSTVRVEGLTSGANITFTFTNGGVNAGLELTSELGSPGTQTATDFTASEKVWIQEVVTSGKASRVLGNVINSPVQLNEVAAGNIGSGGAMDAGGQNINQDAWPFVQLYNFNQTGNVVVEYQKAGVDETTTLVFDTTDGVEYVDIDRTIVPKGAEVHVDIGDPMLNIDPTSADTWFFDHSTGNAHYASNRCHNSSFR